MTTNRPLVYLDSAATSFPKQRALLERMVDIYTEIGVSPGRGSYDLSAEASGFLAEARERAAAFFGAPDPDRVVFTANATDALNLVIQGLVAPGDHVVSTRVEHNSVLRPLYHLKERGEIDYDLVGFDERGLVDPEAVERALRPGTTLAVICHGSQVLGTVQPVAEIAERCRAHGVPVIIDAAQTAGQIPVDMTALGVAAIAFTGHKALRGPSGSGGLVLAPDVEVRSTRFGGTGIDSHSLCHTQSLPHRLEAGTLNLLGIIGLDLGLAQLLDEGLAVSHDREMRLLRRLRAGLTELPGVTVYSPPPRDGDLPLLTCNIAGLLPEDTGDILDGDYGIAVRTGLHCAPLVHEDLGTGPHGAVRLSLGHQNAEEDVDAALEAMRQIATAAGRRPPAALASREAVRPYTSAT
jgi:cysteine desulfurase family protein